MAFVWKICQNEPQEVPACQSDSFSWVPFEDHTCNLRSCWPVIAQFILIPYYKTNSPKSDPQYLISSDFENWRWAGSVLDFQKLSYSVNEDAQLLHAPLQFWKEISKKNFGCETEPPISEWDKIADFENETKPPILK